MIETNASGAQVPCISLFATPENEREAYEFILRVSKQIPEKPDYWCSCGQCERNESDAEDIIAQANARLDRQEEVR